MNQPQFEVIKRFILKKIEQGTWRPGDGVPSENALSEKFSVSRMTARRALSELTDSGVLERVRGAGTFVAEQLPMGSFLEIQSIAREITARGHRHHAEVITLESRKIDAKIKNLLHLDLLHLDSAATCAYSQVLHFENDVPIQLEERFINTRLVPDYLKQDFTQITPSDYLSEVTPLSEADHWIEAVSCPKEIHRLLKMKQATPCLKISRRTFTRKQSTKRHRTDVVNFAVLYHPGDRYRLGGHLNY
ncbi:Mannosyl-D-glycerate transport/metabolism system repressor MngR [Thalassocella blandensis]|nr:Mannosyl-D-glycerate transport/metabolism system repressor MngR [Thalassocella blandensis]